MTRLVPAERAAGLVRLTHPFPSLLVATTTGFLAQMAAGSVATSARLAVAMLGLQVSIGALNDLVDASRDASTKPGKPIPRGIATPADARAIAAGGLAVAVLLVLPGGFPAVAVLAACAACGYAYDLRLSRTPVSWLPLAIALPLVPAFAWVGGTGTLPLALVAVVPAGILAGAGLAIANGLADVDRDRSVGAQTSAVRLGPGRAWLVQTVLLAGTVAVVIGGRPEALAGPSALGLLAGAGAIAIGIVLGGRGIGASGGASARERAWELEAIGVALIAAGWLASLAR